MNVVSRPTPLRRQQGNTLVGIIIGLVIGLVIAVIVALMITKGATPFTDKARNGKLAEPTAGQAADPNKPMYGNREAAREAAKDFAKAATKAAAEPAEPKEAAKDVAKEPKEAKAAPKAPPADPLQAVIAGFSKDEPKAPAAEKSKPAAAAVAKADTGDDKWVYYLQVGAFRETSDAESARAKLALLGFEAAITDRSTDNGVLHRVRMGPYNQIDAMNRARTKLSENGVDVAVVRNQK